MKQSHPFRNTKRSLKIWYQADQNGPSDYGTQESCSFGTQKFDIVSQEPAIFSCPDRVEFSPYSVSVRHILILSYPPRPFIPSGLFPWGFLTKILCACFICTVYMSHPSYSSKEFKIILLVQVPGEEYKVKSSLLCAFLYVCITSCRLDPSNTYTNFMLNFISIRLFNWTHL